MAAFRFLLFAAGQSLLWFGVFAVAGALADVEARQPGSVAFGFGVSTAGLLLSRLAYRLISGVLSLLYGVAFLAPGLVLLPIALGLAQIEPGQINPGRAAGAALTGAGVAMAAGTILVVLGWRWTAAAHSQGRLRHALQIGAVAYGAVLAVAGGISAWGTVLAAVAGAGSTTDVAALAAVAGIAAVLLASGCVLTYHGAGALTGTDSGPFRPASPLLWLILWPASIALGWVLLDRGTLLNSLFLPAHVVAAFAAGGLLISAVVTRTAGGPGAVRLTWRAVLLCWAWGAMGATVASLFLEAVADGIISLSFLARSDAFEGVTSGEQLRAVYEQADEHLSQRELLAATLMLFSVSPPLVEESMKAIGVRLAGRRSLSSYQAFVLGVACGVGFGTLEAVLYGVSALQEDPGQWWSLMLLRGGATSMHALASGLFGLAVYFAVCHRWRRTAAFIAAAMLIHGAWNGLTVIAVSDALPLLDDLSERQVENLLSVVLGVWSLVNVAILVLTARVLAGRPVPPIPSPHAGDTRKGSSLRDDATFGLPQSRMLLVEGGVGQGPAVLRDTARRGRSPRHPQRSRP